ncbi:hypothetical protein Bca4012_058803 [Brassica carinata]
MSTSSSSSSRQVGRRTVFGVPTNCWCCQDLDIWVSETKENRFRRFYRCKISRQKPEETHLSKWIDEAFHDEIWIVDANCMDLLHDLQALRENTQVQLYNQRNWFSVRDQEMRTEINEKMIHMSRAIDDATRQMKEKIDAHLNTHISAKLNNNGKLHKIAAAVAICGAMSYLYWKLL